MPLRVVDFVYSYSAGTKTCTEKFVRNCSHKETKNKAGESECTGQ